MKKRLHIKTSFDTNRICEDMTLRGLLPIHLAERTGLAQSTISRFLVGQVQSVTTANIIAKALGFPVKRYIKSVKQVA